MLRNTIPTQNVLIKGMNRFGGDAEIDGSIEFCQDYALTADDDTEMHVYTDQLFNVTWHPNVHMFTQFMPVILRLDPGIVETTGVMYCVDYDGEPAGKVAKSAYMIVGCIPVAAEADTQFFAINEHVIDLAFDDTTLVTVSSTLVGAAHILDLTPMFAWVNGNENLGISALNVDGTGMTWANVLISTITPKDPECVGQGPQVVLNENAPVGRLAVTAFDTVGEKFTNKYVVTNTGATKDVTLKIRSVFCGV